MWWHALRAPGLQARGLWVRRLAILLLFGITAGACGGTSTAPPTSTPLPSPTPTPSCLTLLPGGTAIGTIANFPDIHLPPGTRATAPQTSGGAAGHFTVIQYDLCFTGTQDDLTGPFSAHHSLVAYLLGAGWGIGPNSFPFDTQFNKPCVSGQYCYISGAAIEGRQLEMDTIVDHGNSLITFHLRLALPPAAPSCNANFTNSPIPGIQVKYGTSYGAVPLPPVSRVAPDNSAGHGGVDVCSAGTGASILTFLTTYMPQNGWTLHAASGSNQTWKSNSGCINVSVPDPALWFMSWPNPGLGVPFADCT
jgi:hypothetical protein